MQKIVASKTEDLQTHIVFAGHPYNQRESQLRSIVLKGINKYQIKSVMWTHIEMIRDTLISKEEMENYLFANDFVTDSVIDDLESMYEDIQRTEEPSAHAITYFLPKLTNEELELVERKDPCYSKTLQSGLEAFLSVSHLKFVRGICWRRTFRIENTSALKTSNCCSVQ